MSTGQAVKVLVVEDDTKVAMLLGSILTSELPVQVCMVPDCESARRKLSEEDLGLVIVDCTLPGGSGPGLVHDLAQAEGSPPVLIMTSTEQAELVASASGLGAVGCVLKDYHLPDSLVAAARQVLSQAIDGCDARDVRLDRAPRSAQADGLDRPLFVVDVKGRLATWNAKFSALTGRSDTDLRQVAAGAVFSGADVGKLKVEDFLASGASRIDLRLDVFSPSEGLVPYEFTTMLLKDQAGRATGICGLGRRLEREGEVPDDAKKIADLVDDIILRMDWEGVVRFANEDAYDFFDKDDSDQMIGHYIAELVDIEDFNKMRRAANRAMDLGRTAMGVVTRLQTPVGLRYVDWNVAPIIEDMKLAGLQISGRDITEHEIAEDFLRQVNIELDAYAHTVSHDLRGPLSCIMAAADTLAHLLDDDIGEQKQELLHEMSRIITESSERAGNLIQRMLDLAERSQVPGTTETVNIKDVVNEVQRDLLVELGRSGIALRIDDDLGTIRADRVHIFQIFSNLIGNAVRHMRGSAAPLVEVMYLGEHEGMHRYLVKDNGAGFPEDAIDRIFSPFVRSDESDGRGIGLAIVEKTVKSYAGYARAFNNGGANVEFGLRDFIDTGR